MPKRATIVLCSSDGTVIGELDPIVVDTPWWQEVRDVVTAVRERDRVGVTVLRLLASSLPPPTKPSAPSDVTYLAELNGSEPPAGMRPSAWTNPPHALRLSYAEPGGPAMILDWAREALDRAGLRATGAPVQMRTWNLSAIWQIPTNEGPTWLKVVPPFFAHEPRLIAWLTPGPVPKLIDWAPGRCLLAHIAGRDAVEGDRRARLRLADVVVTLQRSSISKTYDLLELGLFDWSAPRLEESIPPLAAYATPEDRAAVEQLMASLPDRLAALAACGFPNTLVHGDAHLMNALLGADGDLTLLDWGDAGVGHPFFDVEALERWRSADEVAELHDRLVDLWSDVVPAGTVRHAIALCRPLGALRAALVYAGFLESIEPDERVYHDEDLPGALRTAVALA